MPNLKDRILQMIQDAQAGDTSGTLRDEIEEFKTATDETVARIAQDVHDLGDEVHALKSQPGN